MTVENGPVVAMPPTGAQKANQERLAKLRAKNAKVKAAAAPAKPAKAQAKVAVKAPTKASTNGSGAQMNPCMCGCGTLVKGYFFQGHDARFKGWLLKVERGVLAVKDLPKSVQTAYDWKKRGEGYIPTRNYKGEPHKGYDTTNQ